MANIPPTDDAEQQQHITSSFIALLRAGIGWTTLLGHDPMSPSCNPHESPLLVELGGVKLAVLDDNNAAEKQVDPIVVEALKHDIAAAMAAQADWLVTHHPIRGISKVDKSHDGKTMEGANANLLTAAQVRLCPAGP